MTKKLDLTFVEGVMLKAGLKPLEPYKNSKTPWKCECLKCGKVVSPTFNNTKTKERIGCVYCNSRVTDPRDAIQRMNENKLIPLEPFVSGRKPWKSKCMVCGAIVNPILHDIRRGYGGCKKCGIKKQALMTRMPIKDALSIMEAAKLRPVEPYSRSNKPWKSECLVCGAVVAPTLSSVRSGASCRVCAFKKLAKNQRLPEDEAINRMLKAKLQPLEPYVNSSQAWKSLCLVCGEIVRPHLTSISKGGGCFYCAVAGIQMSKPSYVYLISNDDLNAHKIGIGNKRKNRDRLRKFMNKGWEPYKVWEFNTGAEALKVEKAVFKILRKDLKLPVYLSAEQMPVTGGETETIDSDSISLVQLEKIVNEVIKYLKV